MSGINHLSHTNPPPVILLADDDKMMRLLLREFMEQEGYKVVEVTNGKECTEAFVTIKPDLVLLDAIMPVMDGFNCCKQLVQITKNLWSASLIASTDESTMGKTVISMLCDRTPILMITGLDDPQSVDRAFEAGASDFVTKPIHWAVLRQRVRRLLQQAQLYKQLEAANFTLQQLANLDGLTGVANRRRFDQYLNSQWSHLTQHNLPLSLILCDIDFFKFYNDKYGHPAGDTCLKKVATVLDRSVQKPNDLVARYGGEEFAMILPQTEAIDAVHIAAAMQAGVREQEISHSESPISRYVSLSLGVATIIPSDQYSPKILINAADKALYQAKTQGRNRIILRQVNS